MQNTQFPRSFSTLQMICMSSGSQAGSHYWSCLVHPWCDFDCHCYFVVIHITACWLCSTCYLKMLIFCSIESICDVKDCALSTKIWHVARRRPTFLHCRSDLWCDMMRRLNQDLTCYIKGIDVFAASKHSDMWNTAKTQPRQEIIFFAASKKYVMSSTAQNHLIFDMLHEGGQFMLQCRLTVRRRSWWNSRLALINLWWEALYMLNQDCLAGVPG